MSRSTNASSIVVTTVVLLLFSSVSALANCGVAPVAHVQLLLSSSDAGQTRHTAFRIMADGRIARADWQSNGALLGTAETRRVSGDLYDGMVRAVRALSQPQAQGGSDGTVAPVSRFILLTHAPETGRIRSVGSNGSVGNLDAVLENLMDAMPLSRAPRGDYVWAVPMMQNIGAADLTLTDGTCTSALNADVALALTSPDIVVPAGAGWREYMQQDGRSARERFIADLPDRSAYFGLLRVN